jgi:hypothetical protein
MNNNEKLKIVEQLHAIRGDIVRGKDRHIEEFKRHGFQTHEALKDWNENLSRIVSAIDNVVKDLQVE